MAAPELMLEPRQQAIMDGVTAGAISIGALLTMANSKALSQLFTRHKNQDEEKSV